MSKLIPVGRHNATVFVRTDLVTCMEIVDYSSHAELKIILTLGTCVSERFDSVSGAAEAAVRICNAVNQV